MVRDALGDYCYGGYRGYEMFGNLHIAIPGFTYLSSDALLDFMTNMIKDGSLHKAIYIDEGDRVVNPYWWSKKSQQEAILGCWQDVKLYNTFRYTTHWGDVNIMLRRATQVELMPKYLKLFDCTLAWVIMPFDLRAFMVKAEHISSSFPFYDRHERVI